jgi:hypothetical protein
MIAMLRAGGLFVLCLLGVAGASGAQTNDPPSEGVALSVSRFIEEPAHEKLLRVMGAQNHIPAPFVTDGCSGGMSASWDLMARNFPAFSEIYAEAPPWQSCCVTHDRAYHAAGGATQAVQSFDARLVADTALQLCVLQQGDQARESLGVQFDVAPARIDQAYAVIAQAMFHAVRLGGAPCSGLAWRWGYGFDGCLWE